jgi:hypothetical protein
MTIIYRTFFLICFGLLIGCADENSKIEELVNESEDQRDFNEKHSDAKSAVGQWEYSEQEHVLSIDISDSELACMEITGGNTLVFDVESMSETEMVTFLQNDDSDNEDGDEIVWTRQGEGSGISGSWLNVEDNGIEYLLTLDEDGTAILSLSQVDCSDDDKDDTGYFTDEGCYVDALPELTIAADGQVDDWETGDATPVKINDAVDDSSAEKTGDEIKALYLAQDSKALAIRIELAEPVNTDFRLQGGEYGGSYDISLGTEHDSRGFQIWYEEGEGWKTGMSESGIGLGVLNDNIEMTIDWDVLGGRGQVFSLRVQVQDCSQGMPCDLYDDGPCFSEAN